MDNFDAYEALKADFGIGKEEEKLEEDLYDFVAKKTLDVTMKSMKLAMETEILKQQIKKDDDSGEPTPEAKERLKQMFKNNEELSRYVGQLDIISELAQFMDERKKK